MKNVIVPVDQAKWNDFRIVRLVNGAHKIRSDMDVILDEYRMNMKSITLMMEFYERMVLYPEVTICLNGEDEEEAAAWVKSFFEGN